MSEDFVAPHFQLSKIDQLVILLEIMKWPANKPFAFTVFDDTDGATLANIRPLYSSLADLGFRTTKSVWPLKGSIPDRNEGETCEDVPYKDWLLHLREQGFEIGYHMASWQTSPREKTVLALKRFEELFGESPRTMANHSQCEENIYWGSDRLTGIRKTVYDAVTLGRYRNRYRGHIDGDPLFWGDLCRDKIKYVRGFTFPEINTLNACPIMPYHDPLRPYVNLWFSSSESPTVTSFNQLLCEANQDRLESESGACIVYTHFGAGFCTNGRLNPRFIELMKRLSEKGGWYVPVSDLLNYISESRGTGYISNCERARLEWRWLRYKLRKGRS